MESRGAVPQFLFTGPADAETTILLAHGAGAPMDSPWMDAMAGQLSMRNIRTARFEFAYMAARRSGQRKPPPRAETLMSEYGEAVDMLSVKGRLVIGGKSMGGRVASMIAGDRRSVVALMSWIPSKNHDTETTT